MQSLDKELTKKAIQELTTITKVAQGYYTNPTFHAVASILGVQSSQLNEFIDIVSKTPNVFIFFCKNVGVIVLSCDTSMQDIASKKVKIQHVLDNFPYPEVKGFKRSSNAYNTGVIPMNDSPTSDLDYARKAIDKLQAIGYTPNIFIENDQVKLVKELN